MVFDVEGAGDDVHALDVEVIGHVFGLFDVFLYDLPDDGQPPIEVVLPGRLEVSEQVQELHSGLLELVEIFLFVDSDDDVVLLFYAFFLVLMNPDMIQLQVGVLSPILEGVEHLEFKLLLLLVLHGVVGLKLKDLGVFFSIPLLVFLTQPQSSIPVVGLL